jgi:hypothetical protein
MYTIIDGKVAGLGIPYIKRFKKSNVGMINGPILISRHIGAGAKQNLQNVMYHIIETYGNPKKDISKQN